MTRKEKSKSAGRGNIPAKPAPPPPEVRAPGPDAGPGRIFLRVVLALAGIMALWLLLAWSSVAEQVAGLKNEGWGNFAEIIVRNRNWALVHGLLMLMGGVVLIWFFIFGRTKKPAAYVVALGLSLLVIIGDAFWMSRHYITTMPASYIVENDIVRILKQNPDFQRVVLPTQQGFYNAWLTYLFPYHQIKTLNVTQMPRMPEDYRKYLDAVGRNPLRYWQLGAVGYIVGPAGMIPQIQNDPALKGMTEVVFAFNVAQAPDGGFQVVPGTENQPGQHAVLRCKWEAPRYVLIAGWMPTPDPEALASLASPQYPLWRKVMVAPEFAAGLPESKGAGICGSVIVREYRAGRVVLQVSAEQPACLRISEKYAPGWTATVNGAPVPVRRVDYLFQGVWVEPGMHEVVLSYRADLRSFWLEVIAIGICLMTIVALFLRRWQPQAHASVQGIV